MSAAVPGVGVDQTHDSALKSWVESANGHPDFPIQNLPFGMFSVGEEEPKRRGVAIGDHILDIDACGGLGILPEWKGRPHRALRPAISALLTRGHEAEKLAADLLHESAACTLHLPTPQIGDYTDFYAGIHHARAVGALFRPDEPLLPNYKYLPIGYHGRASSVRPSGEPVRRPSGQRKPATDLDPIIGPSQRLDFELELGIWICAGNPLGHPIPIAETPDYIAGYCLLNDWSARDLQAWEYQPLGPFLAKSFATTVSPWVITPEALAPFRRPQPPRPPRDPHPFPYLWDEADQASGALDIALEILLLTAAMRTAGAEPHRLSASNTGHLYWTPAQLLAHHTSNGCNLRPGDLLGTGTISGPSRHESGSLLELTQGGSEPIALPNGETRRFLEDGDEIILRGHAVAEGAVSIGLGECRAMIIP